MENPYTSLIKAGDRFGHIKITTRMLDTQDNIRYIEGYYKIQSGRFLHCRPHNVYIQRMKWVFDETVLIPINDFEQKQFFHVDHYKLVVDDAAEPFKFVNQYRQRAVYYKDLFDITKATKMVKYVKVKDRFKNVDDPKHSKIVLE